MKLTPYDIEKVPGKRMLTKSENLRILEEFVASDLDCAKVEKFTQQSADSCAGSLTNSIKRYHFGNIKCIARKGEVFLIKTNKNT